MLAPADRNTLLELLRPPAGSSLEQAVGTTFALNLDALLIAPAAFALLEAAGGEQAAIGDVEPLGLLDSIRRHAERLTVFCQAGQIAPPPSHRRLMAYLEPSIIPVAAPRGGVFHPKMWLLSYRSDDGATSYRLLVLSRNLTHDRSWDTALALDSTEDPAGTELPSLAGFVATLPELATGEVQSQRRAALATLADAVRTVRWQLPEGFDSASFLPIGLGEGPVSPPLPAAPDRLLVVSPFIGGSLLRRLAGGNRVLVSLPGWLQQVGVAGLEGFATYVLDDTADVDAAGDVDPGARVADPRTELSGLHAKLYIAEADGRTTVLTGSANATGAGWDANVEAVVQLHGETADIGSLASMLDDRATPITFGRLLLPYDVTEGSGDKVEDPMAGEELDALRRGLAASSWAAEVTPTEGALRIELRTTRAPHLPEDVRVAVWPISVPASARPFETNGTELTADFETSLEGLTAFFAVRLRRDDLETQGVLKARLVGAPVDREQQLLALLIGDAERFLRYLLLLLGDAADNADFASMAEALTASTESRRRLVVNDLPLLEAMLAAVTGGPGKLEHVARLLDELRSAEDVDLVPPEFDELWQAVWAAVDHELIR